MEDILAEIRAFLTERGWDKLRPSDVAKSISIEAAELLEVFQWDSLGIAETRRDRYRMARLKEEIADVLIYALYLPVLLELDPKRLIRAKLRRNARKYPAAAMRRRRNRTHSADDPYIRIKRRYRMARS